MMILGTSSDAQGFECLTAGQSGFSQVWRSRCIPYAISRESKVFEGQTRRNLVATAFQAWSSHSCTDFRFVDSGNTDQVTEFDSGSALRNRNSLASIHTTAELETLMRQGMWPDPALVAATIARFSPQTGEIVDADIVLNDVGYDFFDNTQQCPNTDMINQDLMNTLVHEIGHMIGFEHVLDPEATMFASAGGCETIKRDLSQDDRDGVCSVYPNGAPITTCSPAPDYNSLGTNASQFREQCTRFEGGGCQLNKTPQPQNGSVPLSVLIVLVLAGARRGLRDDAA
jgi:hypothetical protein